MPKNLKLDLSSDKQQITDFQLLHNDFILQGFSLSFWRKFDYYAVFRNQALVTKVFLAGINKVYFTLQTLAISRWTASLMV